MGAPDDIGPGRLPELLREIAEIAGVEAAIALARKLGGQRQYFPVAPDRDHRLSVIMGWQAARLVCRHFNGQMLAVPRATVFLRWFDARQLRREGFSAREIADRLGCSERNVFRLIHGVERGDPRLRGDDDKKQVCAVCGRPVRPRKPKGPDPRQLDFNGWLNRDACQRHGDTCQAPHSDAA